MKNIKFLIENGYSLLKIKHNSKIPLKNDWTNGESLKYDRAISHIKEAGNLGLRTGQRSEIENGFCLVVIDFDIRTKNVDLTNEAVRYLRKLLGDLSQYVTVISGSRTGSAHFYLKCPTDKLPKSKYIINGADWSIMLCANGKQVVIPPSIHPKSKLDYRWKISPEQLPLVNIEDTPLWDVIKPKNVELQDFERDTLEKSITVISELPISEKFKTLITDGDVIGQYPSRSEAIFAVIHALVAVHLNNDNIVAILTDSHNRISEGVLDRAQGDLESAEKWLLPQIKKAHNTQTQQIMDMFDEEAPPKGDQPAGTTQFGGLEPGTLDNFDSPELPRTEWIIPNRLASKFLTLTVAPGGSGKSTLTMQEAVSIASGINCCGTYTGVEAPVWVFNNEDPMDELKRRVAAICARFNVDRNKLLKNFRINSGRYKSGRLLLANESPKKGAYLYDSVLDILEQGIKKYGFKLLVIDPFARSHYLNENDNSSIDMLADALNVLADKTNCAINLVHHCRKLSSGDMNRGNADSIRGASALVNSARIAHTLTTMTKSDAEELGINSEEACFYSRLDSAKNNLSPPSDKAVWFKKESVLIPNGEMRGVLAPWTPPDRNLVEDNHAMKNDILNELNLAWESKDPYKFGKNSAKSIHKLLAEPPYNISKSNCERLIKSLIDSGDIINETIKGSLKGVRVINRG